MSTNGAIHEQLFRLICDEQVGYGMSRVVWTSKILPDCVIKIEEGAGQFQNIIEWETWLRVRDTPMSKWFAACKWISPNGSVLIMERTRPPGMSEYPEKMPAFLCDFKRTNYGMSEGSLVCHDYGTHLMFEHGMTKRLVKAEWWDA